MTRATRRRWLGCTSRRRTGDTGANPALTGTNQLRMVCTLLRPWWQSGQPYRSCRCWCSRHRSQNWPCQRGTASTQPSQLLRTCPRHNARTIRSTRYPGVGWQYQLRTRCIRSCPRCPGTSQSRRLRICDCLCSTHRTLERTSGRLPLQWRQEMPARCLRGSVRSCLTPGYQHIAQLGRPCMSRCSQCQCLC